MDALFRWPSVLVLFLVTVSFSGFVFPWAAEQIDKRAGQAVAPLDITPGFSPEEAYQRLESMGEEGRSFYQMVALTIDVTYPVVYGLFIVALLGMLLSRVFPKLASWKKIAAFGLAGSVFDLIENFGIARYISLFPGRADALASLVSVSGVLKFGLIAFSFTAAIILALAWGIRTLSSTR